MEFPTLGQHCSEASCKKLDFLPVKCDACQKIFCHSHMSYLNHACPSAYQKDVQVPVCPLCNNPVPTKRGEQPDISVGAHIDNNCESDTAKNRRKVFTNQCSAKGCKVKELMPVNCSECSQNYCLKHRHPSDHKCEGKSGALRRKAAEAALARQSSGLFKKSSVTKSNSNKISLGCSASAVQGKLSEDEALARALAASMQDSSLSPALGSEEEAERKAQEDEDLALARAIAESEREQRAMPRSQAAGGSRDRCSLS